MSVPDSYDESKGHKITLSMELGSSRVPSFIGVNPVPLGERYSPIRCS